MKSRSQHLFAFICIVAQLIYSITSTRADTDGPYTYSIDDGFATITEFYDNYEGSLVITNSLGGYPVTRIGDEAFRGCNNLTSIIIVDQVTNIGHLAFKDCIGLTNIIIPISVTSIGYESFYGCASLPTVTIPNGIVGPHSFQNCTNLQSVVTGSGVTLIDHYAFINCNRLERVYVTGNAPGVEWNSFNNSDLATIYYFPDTTGWTDVFGSKFPVLWNPSLASMNISTGVVVCTITGTPGIPVQLEASTNLQTGPWVRQIRTNVTAGLINTMSAIDSDCPATFYRITGP